ncbi:AMP-binding protein [Cellulomonas taurus]|uniref:AMP-binding protein n=1 Tax=Cellulomonas taurus TaxID=2729175 RepID=UPI00145E53F9|nr:AMP-binding protein [Cellulomonas taurus]
MSAPQSLDDRWRAAVATAPDHPAVVDSRGARLSYAQVDDAAARIATWLRAVGVGPGDVVSVQLPNWAEFTCVTIACLRIGAVINPVLTAYREAELRYVLTRCRSRALIVPTRFRCTDYQGLALRLTAEQHHPVAVAVVEHEGASAAGAPTVASLLDQPRLPDELRTPGRGDDIATVLFTSGSEARPKGAMLSHTNVLSAELALASALEVDHRDRVFMPAPLGHATGYLHGLTLPYLVGGTSLLLDVPSGPGCLAMIRAERATCGMAAPSVVRCLLDACETDPSTAGMPDTLRFLGCGGSPVPRALARRALDHGVRLLSIYGSTESAPHTLTTPHDDLERVLTTDGRPVSGVEVRIVDPDTRLPLPIGEVGEEASRGQQVFRGYLGEPELTAAVLDDEGWYYSGDLARLDTDGYLRIVGRRKDVIIRGGENVSAAELELVLHDLPGISAAAVVAMPDARLGECACAFVVVDPGATAPDPAALRREFLSRGVAKYKIPARVEAVDALPLSPAGKVRKDVLRARAVALADIPASPVGARCPSEGAPT